MKTILFLALTALSFNSLAQIETSKLFGSWSTKCTQTQINGQSGHAIETYTFSETLDFSFTRDWFNTQDCSGEVTDSTTEEGVVSIGKENTNFGFSPKGTHEADYTVDGKTTLGLIWVGPSSLRITRGELHSNRNTMLSLFNYFKN